MSNDSAMSSSEYGRSGKKARNKAASVAASVAGGESRKRGASTSIDGRGKRAASASGNLAASRFATGRHDTPGGRDGYVSERQPDYHLRRDDSVCRRLDLGSSDYDWGAPDAGDSSSDDGAGSDYYGK